MFFILKDDIFLVVSFKLCLLVTEVLEVSHYESCFIIRLLIGD